MLEAYWAVVDGALLSLLVGAGALAFVLLGALLVLAKCYQRVPAGQALVVATMNGMVVRRGGTVILPLVQRAETIDLRICALRIERKGYDAVQTIDDAPVDICATFQLKVNDTAEDILRVAQTIGCERAADPTTLRELFEAKFTSALKVTVRQLRFEDLLRHRTDLEDKVAEVIGKDLTGFVLEDVAIDHIEPTPPDIGQAGAFGPFR